MLTAVHSRELSDSKWSAFLAQSANGTFMHERDFLRVQGWDPLAESVVILDRKANPVAAVPLVRTDAGYLVGHPRLTHAGPIVAVGLSQEEMLEAVERIVDFGRQMRAQGVVLRLVPLIFGRQPTDHVRYAVEAHGGRRTAIKMGSALQLGSQIRARSQRRRYINRPKADYSYSEDWQDLPRCWELVENVLRDRHSSAPTHQMWQMMELQRAFPANVSCHVARQGNEVRAGVIVFRFDSAWHLQYIAQDYTMANAGFLDQLIVDVADRAREEGARFLSFGTSHEPTTGQLNLGLDRFKNSFGGGGVAFEEFEVV